MGRPPCCDEYGVKKGPWTPEEDEKLLDYIHKNGHGSWRSLPKLAGLNRCGKSCRLRWTNYLRPDIKRGKFSDEEERVILNLHSVLGNKWSRIATHLPGRTDNEIKNFWNTHLRKKLLQMGIDPNTHKPRTDLNLLVNLSQLLSSPNFGNLMNPFNNAALKLQADAAQLAKIQLVQNLLQALSTSPLPNIDVSNILGSQNLNPFEGLVNGTNTIYGNTSPVPLEFPYPIATPQASDDYQAIANSWACFDGGFDSEILNININSLRIQTENPFPALVSVSPECSSANQTENKISPYITTDSPTSSLFETWAELLMDDETGGSDLNNILE